MGTIRVKMLMFSVTEFSLHWINLVNTESTMKKITKSEAIHVKKKWDVSINTTNTFGYTCTQTLYVCVCVKNQYSSKIWSVFLALWDLNAHLYFGFLTFILRKALIKEKKNVLLGILEKVVRRGHSYSHFCKESSPKSVTAGIDKINKGASRSLFPHHCAYQHGMIEELRIMLQ